MAAAPDPEEVLCSTSGKDQFQRVTRLLISGGTALLREVFDLLCPPSNLPTILKNPATEKQLKAAKLTKPQWDCLFPSPGVYGKSTDFDVTLLFRLLRTICNLTRPATGWDLLPASTDHSLEADLARVKYYRNSVYGHVNQRMEIADEFEFLSLWQEISGALVRIAGQISPAKKREWQEAIDNFLNDPLTTEDERNVQELMEWYRYDMEVKKSIEELKAATDEAMNDIKTSLKDFSGELCEKTRQTNQVIEEKVRDLETAVQEEAQHTRDELGELRQLIKRIGSTSGSSQSTAGHLTREDTTGSSLQFGASEEMGLKVFENSIENDRIVYKPEVWVSEITLKYEQVKALQDDLGKQSLRLLEIIKSFVATYNDLVTIFNERQSRHFSTSSRCLVWTALSCAGSIGLFTSVVGQVLSIGGTYLIIAEQLKLLCSAKEKEGEAKLNQFLVELQQKAGQFKEAFHVFHTKFVSFKQHLKDITEFCHEHPNKLIVLRECGQVSTQQVLRDVSAFMSRLEEFASTASNSREVHQEMILAEETMASNKDVGTVENESSVQEDDLLMKWKRLLTAPIILTTRTMTYH